jgi:hypothetical protein
MTTDALNLFSRSVDTPAPNAPVPNPDHSHSAVNLGSMRRRTLVQPRSFFLRSPNTSLHRDTTAPPGYNATHRVHGIFGLGSDLSR